MLKLLNDSNFLLNTNSSKVFSIEYLNITIPIRAYNIKKKKKKTRQRRNWSRVCRPCRKFIVCFTGWHSRVPLR